jgi:exodeoxyribonuclease V beta subunit
MKTFDSLQVSLAGMNLIEASAGTGKTYTITSLYVRLLLEKSLLPEQILVVTFTEAATKEIKERVRARLQTVLAVLQGEQEAGDDYFLAGLVDRYLGDKKATAVLVNAVRSLDLAAIYTIHGFCKRMLAECAFESGVDFESEFAGDDAAILQQVVDDFWRIEAPGWGRILTGYLYAQGCSSDSLLKDLQGVVLQTIAFGRCILLTPPDRAKVDPAELVNHLAGLWASERSDIAAALTSGALSQARDKYCAANLSAWFAELDAYFQDPKQVVLPADVFLKFSAGSLAAHTKKKKTTPMHRFFDLADTLIQELEQAYGAIRLACIEYCRKELPARKRQHGIMTYDDLLLGVRNGLKAPGAGTTMTELVRSRYPAALIDEFQDTDPLQFEIFERLYRDTPCCVFLIGDPKQAIYSFRGADVFAYLRASAATANQYTLGTNFRSEASLIAAVNKLFGLHSNAFLFEEIKFRSVQAAENLLEPLCITGDDDKPLTFWFFDEQPNKNDARYFLARGVADKIVQLLNLGRQGNARIGKRPLAAADMAVLVRTHREGELVRQALLDKGVPAVVHSQESIFSSPEARDVQFLLAGICSPLEKNKLHAALSTGLLGYRAEDLCDLEENEQAWERILDRFVGYYQQWSERGFAVMFRRLLERERVSERVAGLAGAERCLTNLRHLLDLLQAIANSEELGPEELLGWLRAKRHGVEKLDDEDQLRLESDENLVTIATIHKSKGLEYPVVFCPFMWDTRVGKRSQTSYAVFHDDSKILRIDLGTEKIEQHHSLQQQEMLAEEMRLLYVAVTRARNRCYLGWGKVGTGGRGVSDRSALGYLLQQNGADGNPGKSGENGSVPEIYEGASGLTLKELAAAAPQAVGIEALPETAHLQVIERPDIGITDRSRTLRRELTPSDTIQSFSGLQFQHDIEEPDHDGESGIVLRHGPPGQDESGERSLFSFPRGRRAGSCLHAIFENLDFSDLEGKGAIQVVAGWLRRFGFDEEWAVPVQQGLSDVCRTPLLHDKGAFCLASLTKAHRLDELEFYYPVPLLSAEKLRSIFVRHLDNKVTAGDRERSASKERRKGNGFMKGFIDLVFEWQGQLYLVDYKSNHLGSSVEDYGRPQLAAAMTEARYDLQYYIYSVTLHRYLKKRLRSNYDYDRYFGGVLYLFVRGMKPERGPEFGVYFDRPRKEVIESLDRSLAT